MKKTYAMRIVELDKTNFPKNIHVTSADEAKTITEILGLDELNDFELQNMRGMVVMFYDSKQSDALLNAEHSAFESAMNKMMSVTAVIDHIKFKRGLAV